MADKLDKKIVSEGNKTDFPKNGDTVTIEYTGWLHDPKAENNRGTKSVSHSSISLLFTYSLLDSTAPLDEATSQLKLVSAESFRVRLKRLRALRARFADTAT